MKKKIGDLKKEPEAHVLRNRSGALSRWITGPALRFLFVIILLGSVMLFVLIASILGE